jgi:hypothetical protein
MVSPWSPTRSSRFQLGLNPTRSVIFAVFSALQASIEALFPNSATLCRDKPFEWTAAAQAAFDTLKECTTTAPILAFPSADPKHRWSLSTDASNFAVGGVLSLDCDNGLRPVALRSQKIFRAERNYPVHDKEMLAIIDCMRAWRCYLQSRHVTIWTDHCSLSFFDRQAKLAQRQIR